MILLAQGLAELLLCSSHASSIQNAMGLLVVRQGILVVFKILSECYKEILFYVYSSDRKLSGVKHRKACKRIMLEQKACLT
jgi:hypothetical protein